MDNKKIEVTITEEDGVLYDLVKDYVSSSFVKNILMAAAELYRFCNSNSGVLEGNPSPEVYRDSVLVNKSKEELLELKQQFQSDILLMASDFNPDECECEVSREPGQWFIDEDNIIGYMALMIDELLKK